MINHSMINSGDRIITALSGGADSVCLLYLLNGLKNKLNFTLSAVHVNHNLRGNESDRDQAFCEDLCGKLGVELHTVSVDVTAETKSKKQSIETAARKLRYEVFENIRNKYTDQNVKIATAHTADDSVETMLFHLIRGTGLKGLTGIPAVRSHIIRPLIRVSRAEIEAYLTDISAEYVTDSSNADDNFTRNKIRSRLIPVIKEINPCFSATAQNTMLNLAEDEKYISDTAQKYFDTNDVNEFSELSDSVLKRVIIHKTAELNMSLNQPQINAVAKIIRQKRGKTQLSGETHARIRKGILEFYHENCDFPQNGFTLPFPDEFPLEIKIPSGKIKLSLINARIYDKNNRQRNFYIMDHDKFPDNACIRFRSPGDTIKIMHAGTKPLKKFFNEYAAAPETRGKIPLIACGSDVLCVPGMMVSETVRVETNTKNILKVEIVYE